MSAWIVSRAHIDVMVQALCESEMVAEHPDLVGRMLWSENVFSLAYCYPGDGDGDRPGPIDFRDDDALTYTYRRPSVRLTRHDVLIALQCWDYQSCEHPGYGESEPCRWVDRLIKSLQAAGADREPLTKADVNGYTRDIAWGYLVDDTVHSTLVERAS